MYLGNVGRVHAARHGQQHAEADVPPGQDANQDDLRDGGVAALHTEGEELRVAGRRLDHPCCLLSTLVTCAQREAEEGSWNERFSRH